MKKQRMAATTESEAMAAPMQIRMRIHPWADNAIDLIAEVERRPKVDQYGIILESITELCRKCPEKLAELGVISQRAAAQLREHYAA